MLALPFVFNVKTDIIYIVILIACVVTAFLINNITNYSLFANSFYYSNPQRQRYIFYLTILDCFCIFLLDIFFLVKKLQTIYELHDENKNIELEKQDILRKAELRQRESLQMKQELLISNLRLAQKNELLQKTRELDNNQIDKLIQQENNKDKDFDDINQMYLNISPEFYQRLNKKAAPNKLTTLDLKYCAYIGARKSNKDIAKILNVDYRSVKSHKHDLKRKLKLGNSESLDFFIQHIPASLDDLDNNNTTMPV
jgi:DNA-binding CsgD family transcriptional regulator